MTSRTLRASFYFFLMFLLLTIINFQIPIFSFIVTQSFKIYATLQWGHHFDFEKAYFDGTKLIIKMPHYENDANFSAEKLTLDWRYNPKKWRLETTIAIDRPRIHLNSLAPSNHRNWIGHLKKSNGTWIKSSPYFFIQKGLLSLALDDGPYQLISFDLEGSVRSGGLITLYFNPSDPIENTIELHAKRHSEKIDLFCKCKKISCAALNSILELFECKIWPLKISSGTLSGEAKTILSYNHSPSLEGEFSIEQLKIEQNDLGLTCDVELLSFRFDQHKKELKVLKPGFITYGIRKWPLETILEKITVEDVCLRNSQEFLTIKLKCPLEESLALLFTEKNHNPLHSAIKKSFNEHNLTLITSIKRRKQCLELSGNIQIENPSLDLINLTHFGLTWKKLERNAKRRTFTPIGWFHIKQLPLEKFLSPLIFPGDEAVVRGHAEVKGSFEGPLFTFLYDVENFSFEHENVLIEANQLCSSVPGQLLGSHQIDFHTYAHEGKLPIQGVSCHAHNLFLENMEGTLFIKDNQIKASGLECLCNDIYFSTNLELDYYLPNAFNLSVHCPFFSGKVSQFQKILPSSGLNSLFNAVPFEGDIMAKEKGIRLNLAISPQDYFFEAKVQGSIAEGSLFDEEKEIGLKGIYTDISYDHQKQTLDFSDIQGTLLIGKPNHLEEFLLTGSSIQFSHLFNPNMNLDISIVQQDKEIFRLCGYSQDDDEEGIKKFHLSPVSHLIGFYPTDCQCKFKDWNHLQSLSFHSNIDLKKLTQDIKIFRKCGFLFLTPRIIESVIQFFPKGEYSEFFLNYNLTNRCYYYGVNGPKVMGGNFLKNPFYLRGRKQDKKWIIDELKFNQWSCYAELKQEEGHWKIPTLGITHGHSLIGIEGCYVPKDGQFLAKVNRCEFNFAKLKDRIAWPLLFIQTQNLKLEHFNIEFLRDELQFTTTLYKNQTAYQLVYQAYWPALQTGKCILTHSNAHLPSSFSIPLVFYWENDPRTGFKITSIQGKLEDFPFDLDSKNSLHKLIKKYKKYPFPYRRKLSRFIDPQYG